MRRANVSLSWIAEHIKDGSIEEFFVCRCADHQIHLKVTFWNREKCKRETYYSNKFEAGLVLSFANQMTRKFNTCSRDPIHGERYSNCPF